MNQTIYNQIKQEIETDFDNKMRCLNELNTYLGPFNSKVPLKSTPKPLVSPPKPEMKLLKEMPANTVSRPGGSSKYVKKLVACETKGCIKKVNPERKACEVCSKKCCHDHMRESICKECKSVGA